MSVQKYIIDDYIGVTINFLTCIKPSEKITKSKSRHVCLRCCCGNIVHAALNHFANGLRKSCGCRKIGMNVTHGLSNHKIHHLWLYMKGRCSNPNNTNYHNYGGRGIQVCNEWSKNFISFFNWAIKNGWEKGLELDRINNEGNYEPTNCRFVTKKINSNNRRKSIFLLFNGEKYSVSQWSEKLGITKSTILYRLNKRMPTHKILSTTPYTTYYRL